MLRANRFIPLVALMALFAPIALPAAELREETLRAWNGYVRGAQEQVEARATGQKHFLWIDEIPNGAERVRKGEIVVGPARGNGSRSVSHGLIHDWIGTIFVPDAEIDHVFAVVRDYDRYKDYYAPAVVESKSLREADGQQSFSMVLQQKVAFVTAAMATDYQSHYVRVDPNRWYSVARSTRIQQVQHFGQEDEERLPPDEGSGYLWRLYSVARFEHRDGGVYVEMEALGLSRDIPFTVRWLVDPIVSQLPRTSIAASLRQTRDAVRTVTAKSKRHNLLLDPSTVAKAHETSAALGGGAQ